MFALSKMIPFKIKIVYKTNYRYRKCIKESLLTTMERDLQTSSIIDKNIKSNKKQDF